MPSDHMIRTAVDLHLLYGWTYEYLLGTEPDERTRRRIRELEREYQIIGRNTK